MNAGMARRRRGKWLVAACAAILVLSAVAIAAHPADRAAFALMTAAFCVGLPMAGVLALVVFLNWRARREGLGIIDGRVVFVYTSRRGWNELITNNVLCLLDPQRVCVLDRCRPRAPVRPALRCVTLELARLRTRPPSPFLMSIPPRGRARLTPLHEHMRPFMNCRKRSSVAQSRIRELLADALCEHAGAATSTGRADRQRVRGSRERRV